MELTATVTTARQSCGSVPGAATRSRPLSEAPLAAPDVTHRVKMPGCSGGADRVVFICPPNNVTAARAGWFSHHQYKLYCDFH